MVEKQKIYINLDDSGKLTPKEQISVYGGVVFFSKKEKDKFITQYRSIIEDIKCKYCSNSDNCNKKCPEIKNTNIKPSDKRRIMNYLKKYYTVGLIIKNDNVYDHIKTNKAAKGRFTDYSIRRMIKELINELIRLNMINPNLPLELIINIDEQSTKSNGYYNLRDGLLEELKYGISNYNYSKTLKPIIFSELSINISYQDSGKNHLVQAADLIAGTTRKISINDLKNKTKKVDDFLNFEITLP